MSSKSEQERLLRHDDPLAYHQASFWINPDAVPISQTEIAQLMFSYCRMIEHLQIHL